MARKKDTISKNNSKFIVLAFALIGFIIGITLLLFIRSPNTDFEGEFTSGYLISAKK